MDFPPCAREVKVLLAGRYPLSISFDRRSMLLDRAAAFYDLIFSEMKTWTAADGLFTVPQPLVHYVGAEDCFGDPGYVQISSLL